jgi:quercetin dioxygenase-like cupin family protein
MKRKKNYLLFIIVSLIISKSMAQQNVITRKNLESAIMDQKVTKVEVQEITFSPTQTAPKHLHPCSVVGYIKSGSVLFQIEGKEPMMLKEGDSFYEPKNVNILHFDNTSKDKPMIFIAFYLKGNNEENVKLVD